jgi:hypothetical protein
MIEDSVEVPIRCVRAVPGARCDDQLRRATALAGSKLLTPNSVGLATFLGLGIPWGNACELRARGAALVLTD